MDKPRNQFEEVYAKVRERLERDRAIHDKDSEVRKQREEEANRQMFYGEAHRHGKAKT